MTAILPKSMFRHWGAQLHGASFARRALSITVLGLSFLFLFFTARKAGITAASLTIGMRDVALLGVCGLAYAGLLILLARAWALVPASADRGINARQAIAVYGLSVLPKYVPGSVLQYGSRQLLGRDYGWNTPLMARASAIEVMLHILCSFAVAASLLVPVGAAGALTERTWLFAAAGVALLVAAGVAMAAGPKIPKRILAEAICCQGLFFAGMAVLAMICALMAGQPHATLPAVGGLFLLSWLIGFVVPIMPGGIGVREVIGVALLSGVTGTEAALFIQLGMRFITLAGDVAIFCSGLVCRWSLRRSGRDAAP